MEWRARHNCCSEEDIAWALQPVLGGTYTIQQLIDEVQSMIHAGHRYRNIEKQLGVGSFLVLGKDVAETVLVTFFFTSLNS